MITHRFAIKEDTYSICEDFSEMRGHYVYSVLKVGDTQLLTGRDAEIVVAEFCAGEYGRAYFVSDGPFVWPVEPSY